VKSGNASKRENNSSYGGGNRSGAEISCGVFCADAAGRSDAVSQAAGKRVHLKLEMELPTASFKVRGAMWALAERMKKEAVEEMIASSTGITAQRLRMQRKTRSESDDLLPEHCNPVKRERIIAWARRLWRREAADLAAAF